MIAFYLMIKAAVNFNTFRNIVSIKINNLKLAVTVKIKIIGKKERKQLFRVPMLDIRKDYTMREKLLLIQ